MAKNRVMAEKNARVRKADIELKKNRNKIEIAAKTIMGEITEEDREHVYHIPTYNNGVHIAKTNGRTTLTRRKTKSALKLALLTRI